MSPRRFSCRWLWPSFCRSCFSPAVRILRRTGLPNTPAVLLVAATAFAIIFGVGTLITQQVGSLVQEMPRYQTTLRDKVKSLKEVAKGGSGALKQASDALKDLQDELDKPAAQPTGPGVTISPMQGEMRSGDRSPIPVVVRTPSPTPLDQLQGIIGVIVQASRYGGACGAVRAVSADAA